MTENTKQGLLIGLSVMIGFVIAVFLQQIGILKPFGAAQQVAIQDQASPEAVSQATAQQPQPVRSAPQPVDVHNKFCPVSHRPIGVMGPGVQEVYNGKIYHLCCGGCVSAFESDPEPYSRIADSEIK